MIGLVRAETRRLTLRRLFRLLAALVVAGIVISAVYVFVRSSSDPRSGLVDARRAVEDCERERRRFSAERGEGSVEAFVCPSVADLRPGFDRRFRYSQTMPNATRGVAVPLFLLSFVVGASFVGAEWGTGAMATLLTWEPRRARVMTAKVVACTAVAAAAVAGTLALLTVVHLPAGAFRGTLANTTARWWLTQTGIWARGAGVAAFGSALGIGLAMLVRNTAGAIGVGFVYGVFLDPLLGTVGHARYRPWLLQHNLPRLLGFPVEVARPVQTEGPGVTLTTEVVASVARPVVLLSIYAAVILLAAFAAFRTRDVT